MKHIVYLDTDYLNSYVSQFLGGRPKSSTVETGNTQASGTINSTQNEVDAGLSVPLAKVGAVLNSEDITEIKDTAYGKELVEKVFHDNLLNILEKNLEENSEIGLDFDKASLGQYVRIKAKFNAIDVDYYNSLVSQENEGKLVTALSFTEINKLSVNDKDGRKKIQNRIKNEVVIPFRGAIEFIGINMPYKQVFFFDNFIAPVRKKMLREEINYINQVYDGEITVIGKVTRKNKNTNIVKSMKEDFFSLTDLFKNKRTLINDEVQGIVVPIALYFE